MKEYYKILDIPKDAENGDVKKAYFKLVRKFPPDRYPNEFMDIREAYEILIDDNTRKQYDLTDTMPDIAKAYFNEGRKQLEFGDARRAIKLLEEVRTVYSGFSVINSLLGDAYMANENSVKAIQIFDQLVKDEPNNAGYTGKLAHAYLLRGWYKKANEQYQEALRLDEDNISLWLGYINCLLDAEDIIKAKKTILVAIKISNKKGWDSLELYYHMVQIDIMTKDQASMTKHLEEMKDLALKNEDEKSNVAWFLAHLSQELIEYGLDVESMAAIHTAFELQPEDADILRIKKEIENKGKMASLVRKLRSDDAIDDFFKDMIEFEIDMCEEKNCSDCEFGQFSYEMDVIFEINLYRADVLYLKREYPELYGLKKEFFDNVLNKKNEQRLMDTYRKKLIKFMKQNPEKFDREIQKDASLFNLSDEDGTEMPYVRPEAKIGRNDPCPCGSGKKYKRCCGA